MGKTISIKQVLLYLVPRPVKESKMRFFNSDCYGHEEITGSQFRIQRKEKSQLIRVSLKKERERKTTMTRIRRDEPPLRLVSYELLLLAPA